MTGLKHTAGRAHAQTPEGVEWYAQLLGVLDSQMGLLGELDALSQRQSGLIDGVDIEPLLAVLAERQGALDRIMGSGRTAESLRRCWSMARETLPTEHNDEVQRRLDAIADLADRIALRDASDQARLKRRLEAVSGELSGVAASRRAVTAYSAPGAAASPRFQDREG